jgi:hypothetical protein
MHNVFRIRKEEKCYERSQGRWSIARRAAKSLHAPSFFRTCLARNQALDRSSKGKQAAAAKTRFTRTVLYLIRAMLASHHISVLVLEIDDLA